MTIVLGNYIDYHIKTKRGLPAYNPAGSNRMLRLAAALKSVDEEAIILSPACALSMKWTGTFYHKEEISFCNNIKIKYCSTIGLPFIGVIYEQFVVLLTIWKLSKEISVNSIIVYCYYPSSVLSSLFSKYFLGIKIIEDLEDICIPKLSDWKRSTEANPVQQLVGWFLMKVVVNIADAIIIPTSKFFQFLKHKNKVELISGCIEVPDYSANYHHNEKDKVNVLFSGALEDENGIPLLVDFFKKIDIDLKLSQKFIFHISGHGSKEVWLKNEVVNLKNVQINFHGFLNEKNYINLLANVSVALVLQNPMGRYSEYKTPSKGYEYISNGKVVVVSEIGDFAQLPEDVVILLKSYNADDLLDIFEKMTSDQLHYISGNAYEYAKINWDSSVVGLKLKKMIFSTK
jgi:glycosyltransferase involved in cell wall biosynthesis